MYRIAEFYCEHKFLRMIYLGNRRNTCGFYIYEYMVWTKLFRARVHLFGAIFLRPLPSSMFVSFAVDSMIEETMCTRIFGTTILVKNLHVGTKGMNIHDLFAVAVLKSDVIVGHIP